MKQQYSGAMPRQEFNRLIAYYNAARIERSHVNHLVGRKRAKGKAMGVGVVLEKSFVKPQVGIERVYIQHRID